ncbi:MAG: hypothetical protein MZV70_65585 [Desulfobacterales bacterium]|nr:hypothetical protein [Desulfobacterales bacterium]
MKDKRNQIAGSLTLADQKRHRAGAHHRHAAERCVLLDEVMAGLNPTETDEAVEADPQNPRDGAHPHRRGARHGGDHGHLPADCRSSTRGS